MFIPDHILSNSLEYTSVAICFDILVAIAFKCAGKNRYARFIWMTVKRLIILYLGLGYLYIHPFPDLDAAARPVIRVIAYWIRLYDRW